MSPSESKFDVLVVRPGRVCSIPGPALRNVVVANLLWGMCGSDQGNLRRFGSTSDPAAVSEGPEGDFLLPLLLERERERSQEKTLVSVKIGTSGRMNGIEAMIMTKKSCILRSSCQRRLCYQDLKGFNSRAQHVGM